MLPKPPSENLTTITNVDKC